MTQTLTPASETTDLAQALADNFGFAEFRPLQEEAVQAAVDGRDLLVVMPTGAGKSLCFQLPAALQTGVTLVISPLIALMRDQVDALNKRDAFRRLGCACLTSGQSAEANRVLLAALRAGGLRLCYVAPERFRSAAFRDALRAVNIARFVVDEAHCISEWGHDFRPDYLALKDVIESVGRPPLTALTATATRRVQQSIVDNLGMRNPEILVGGFDRPNLHFSVHRCKSDFEREDKLARALPKLAAMGGSGLIYVATRKQCEQVSELADHALSAVGNHAAPYHAGLDPDLRTETQRRWLDGELQVLVATNAFGMGIDKADVRFVVHCACPDSIESYYQEAGRAGRDGKKSRCVVLYHFADRKTREWFIDNEALTVDAVQAAHTDLVRRGGETVEIPKFAWARGLGWSETKARLALGEIERAGLIARQGETSDDVSLRILDRTFPSAALSKIRADLARQRQERYRRLDEIIDYCKTTACRRRTILDYFGDPEEPETRAFCCDNCEKPTPAPAESGGRSSARTPMPAEIDTKDIHSLLQGLDALRPALGKPRLNKLLRATGTRETPGQSTEDNPLYGIFRGSTRGAVDNFLARLVEDNLLRQGDEDEYFVCTITAAGRAAWQDKTPLAVPIPGVLGAWSAAESGDAGELFEKLREWRAGEASAAGLPPYCILPDKTLREIARCKPESDDELGLISGIGPRKLENYGTAVLRVVRES